MRENKEMHFSSGINRPPYEANDGFLQVTSGCSHNTCRFCTLFADAPFRVSDMDEVASDIRELARMNVPFRRIFLQGADPFVLSTNRLLEIADLVHMYLPSVESIGGYGRIDNVRNKSVEDLRKLVAAGYSNFYFGNESGDDVLLKRMDKGYDAEEIVTQCGKMDEAGMTYVLNFLGGLGGHGYGLDHARRTAEIINRTHPTLIYASELTLFPDTPLSRDVDDGRFVEATEEERLEEMKEFIRCLDIETVFKAEHVTIPIPVRGVLPRDKQRMLHQLDEEIEMAKNGDLDDFREQVRTL